MVSVIIPVYNVASYLPACLDSVLRQTVTDFELIMVNDGSTDGSDEICNDYACRDARISVLHQKNGGPAAARNAALEVAIGEQIAFVDGDDLIHSHYLESLLKTMQETGADLVTVSHQMYSESQRMSFDYTKLSASVSVKVSNKTISGQEALLSMLYQQGPVDSAPWAKLFSRELLQSVRFPLVYRVYEDLYFMAQVLPLARRIVSIDTPLYYYFKQPQGTLCSLSSQRTDAFDALLLLEQEYLVTQQTTLVRAVRERRLSVSFNILRLLSKLPHTDANKAMAHRCWTHIKRLRRESIRDSKARLKNRLIAFASYLIYR